MMGMFDKMKSEDAQRKEADRKAAEAAIREKPEYTQFVEKARMEAMMARDKKRIEEHYSAAKKNPLGDGPLGGMFNTMASAASAEFSQKSLPKPTGGGNNGFINPNPPMPDWMMKKKKVE